jgi:hypothetical protein
MDEWKQKNAAVSVVGIVAGVSLVIVLFFAIFARDHLPVAGWIVTMLAIMGSIVAPLAGRRN